MSYGNIVPANEKTHMIKVSGYFLQYLLLCEIAHIRGEKVPYDVEPIAPKDMVQLCDFFVRISRNEPGGKFKFTYYPFSDVHSEKGVTFVSVEKNLWYYLRNHTVQILYDRYKEYILDLPQKFSEFCREKRVSKFIFIDGEVFYVNEQTNEKLVENRNLRESLHKFKAEEESTGPMEKSEKKESAIVKTNPAVDAAMAGFKMSLCDKAGELLLEAVISAFPELKSKLDDRIPRSLAKALSAHALIFTINATDYEHKQKVTEMCLEVIKVSALDTSRSGMEHLNPLLHRLLELATQFQKSSGQIEGSVQS